MEQTDLIFQRYDFNGDNRLTFTEFCQIFLPQSEENSRLMDDLISRPPASAQMDSETIELLQKLLRSHLDLE